MSAASAATPRSQPADWSTVDEPCPTAPVYAIPAKGGDPVGSRTSRPLRVHEAERRAGCCASEALPPARSDIRLKLMDDRPGRLQLRTSPSGSPGAYSIGTREHCGKTGEAVTLPTLAPGGANPVLVDAAGMVQKVSTMASATTSRSSRSGPSSREVSLTIAVAGRSCGSYGGVRARGQVFHHGHGLGRRHPRYAVRGPSRLPGSRPPRLVRPWCPATRAAPSGSTLGAGVHDLDPPGRRQQTGRRATSPHAHGPHPPDRK